MPRSELLGAPRRSTTTYYDADGNVTGSSVTEHDSAWTPHDTDTVLAVQEHEDSLCRCGRPIYETTGKENTFRFVADVRYCHACKARDVLKRQIERQEGQSPGVQIVVREAHGWEH